MQMEQNGIVIQRASDGRCYIEIDGYVIPFTVKEGMQTLLTRHPTEQELRTLETVDLTNDLIWSPEAINEKDVTSEEYNLLLQDVEGKQVRRTYLQKRLTNKIRKMQDARQSDWYKFNKYFLCPGEDIMKDTLRHNTRAGKTSHSIPMRKHFRSRNPLLSRNCLREGFATDTVFSKVTSFEGYNCAQAFTGIESNFRATHGMVTEKNGPEAMLDFFRNDGVPISLVRDNSKMKTSKKWNDYMRRFWVKDKFIEPHHPHQNPLERDMAHRKADMTKIMIDRNVDPRGWFKVMEHTADIHNHRANKKNDGHLPSMTAAKGEIGDITLLTEFLFNEEVLYQEYDYKFPEQGGNEKKGYWYGRAPNHGDAMCS